MKTYKKTVEVKNDQVEMYKKAYLTRYAQKLATMTLYHFCPKAESEPLDGDQTEDLAKEYLKELNNLMGNK